MDRFEGAWTPVRMFVLAFGVVYLLVGLAGFIGPLVTDAGGGGEGRLFGVFAVDGVHNVIHLLVGGVAIAAAMRTDAAVWTSRIFGVVFLVLAVWGLGLVGAAGSETAQLAGIMHVNPADNWLHIATSALFLFFGFAPWAAEERVGEGPRRSPLRRRGSAAGRH